jgi:hypothetical protein
MDWTTVVTVSASVLIALTGYVATYVYGLRLARRKDRLERVNRQLSECYGPLLALVSSGSAAWNEFREVYRPSRAGFWDGSPPPTRQEGDAWRLWMTEVFMPLNERTVDVITNHADLLIESEMPQCLLDACAHVAAYRPVLKRWEQGDFSENTSLINFPSKELLEYVSAAFVGLKAEQTELLRGERPEAMQQSETATSSDWPPPPRFANRRRT